MPSQQSPEKLIAAGAPIKELRPYFRTRKEAVEFYGYTRQQEYAPQTVRGNCCICEWKPGEMAVEFHWGAAFPKFKPGWVSVAAAASGHVLSLMHLVQSQWLVFRTYHPMCRACWRGILVRRALRGFLLFVCGCMVMAGAVMIPVGLLGPVFMTYRRDNSDFYLVAAGGFALIAGFFLFRSLLDRVVVPFSLRHVPRWPFRYYSCASATPTSAMDSELNQPTGSPIVVPTVPQGKLRTTWKETVSVLFLIFALVCGVLLIADGFRRGERYLGWIGTIGSLLGFIGFYWWDMRSRRRGGQRSPGG